MSISFIVTITFLNEWSTRSKLQVTLYYLSHLTTTGGDPGLLISEGADLDIFWGVTKKLKQKSEFPISNPLPILDCRGRAVDFQDF